MATTIASLLPRFRLMAALVPQPVAEFAIREAAIDFCRRTNIVTELIPAFDTTPGQPHYALVTAAPTLTRTVQAHEVWADGAEIPPVTASHLKDEYGEWPELAGAPIAYMQLSERSVRLFRIPEAAVRITARVATAPTETAASIDDDLADRWWKAIIAGALARVYMMPGQPFTNPELAMASGEAFMQYVSEAKHAAYTGYTKARTRTKAVFF